MYHTKLNMLNTKKVRGPNLASFLLISSYEDLRHEWEEVT